MVLAQNLLDRSLVERIMRVRREIHAEPELSHQETKTKARLLRELESIGITAIVPVGPTGFSFDIVGQAAGPDRMVGIRGEMDALPIHEAADVPFASRNPGVMHACGHDSHTAMVLGCALWFQENLASFPGRVRFYFQHSEEDLPSGAKEFVEAGLADDVDAVLGIHVDPLLQTGMVASPAGVFACSSDHFDIVITGRASHGGRPHEGVDAIATAATLIQEINKIVAHNADPMVPLVVTVGKVSGGNAHNIISDRVQIAGTIRSGQAEVRSLVHRRLRKIASVVAQMHDASAEVSIAEDGPLLINDERVASIVRAAATKVTGTTSVLSDAGMWSASDDFAYFSNVAPSTYFRLGVRSEAKDAVFPLHHPNFSLDEDALGIGAAVLVQAALDHLRS